MASSSLNLTSTTLIGKDENKKLVQFMNTLYDDKNSAEFRQPVDWKYLGLFDYPQIIKNPMDLGSIKKNLKNNKYKSIEECLNDVQLIWDNCKTYNSEGSWIYDLALKLENLMLKQIQVHFNFLKISKEINKNVQNDEGFDDTENISELTYDQKLLFSNKVKSISQEQLGELVRYLQNNNSQCIKEVERDRCQIVVDNINKRVFEKLNEMIEEWLVQDNPHTKIKIK